VRELGGQLEEGEHGQWRAIVTRGALEVAARVSSNGFGDVIAFEVKAPRAWVPEGVIAPPNLSRAGHERAWNVRPEGIALDPRLVDVLFSPAAIGISNIQDRVVAAMFRRDDSNDDAHVEDVRRAIDALLAIV
jgi:hypothetical protein